MLGQVYEGVSVDTVCFRTLDEVKVGCLARIQVYRSVVIERESRSSSSGTSQITTAS